MTRKIARARAEAEAPDPGQPPKDGQLRLATDEELFAGLRQGSEAHFNTLYERYFQRIYSFVHVRLRNHADAEELTQETFTVVFRNANGFGGRSTPLAWIYGIAKNTILSHLRRNRLYSERLEQAGPEPLVTSSPTWSFNPEEQLALDRYATVLGDQLRSVADWQAEAFYLRHVENLSIPEICRRTDRSNDAVRSGLYRVKRLLLDASEEAGAAGA